MDIRENREGDALVLVPNGSLAGSEESREIEAKLGAALKSGLRQVVLDCTSVGQLSSDAIRVLLMTSRKLDRGSGRLVLFGLNSELKRAFTISGFNKDFKIATTREEALQCVAEPVQRTPAKPVARRPQTVAAPVTDAKPATPPPQDEQPATVVFSPAQFADPRVAVAAALFDALVVDIPSRHVVPSNVPRADAQQLADALVAALHADAS